MSELKKYADKKGNSYPHLYLDIETKEFWAVVRVGEKVKKKNLKTTEYLRAVTLLPTTIAELGNKETNKEQRRRENAEAEKLLSDYWALLRKHKVTHDVKESTLQRFDTVWKHDLEPYLGSWPPHKVKPDIIPDYLIWHKENRGTQLVNVYKYLGNLFSYMVRIGALEIKNVPFLELPKNEIKHHAKKKGRIISDDEREALLRHSKGFMKLLNELGSSLGPRKMEIGSLEKQKIKKEQGRYLIYLEADDTKTGLARVIPVPKHLGGLLERQMADTFGSPYLFPQVRDQSKHMTSQLIDKEWKQIKIRAGIKGRLRWHDWRHTKATEMAQKKINVVLAATLLGMSIKTFQKTYLNLTGQDLMAVVDELSKGDV